MVNPALPAYSRARRSAAVSRSFSPSQRASSASTRFSIAARSASRHWLRSSCARRALSSAACAFATSFSRLARSFALAASSLRRSASRRLCSRSKSAAALRASLSLISGACRLLGFGRRPFLRPPSSPRSVGRPRVLGEASVRSRRALEHHARLGHRLGDHVGVVGLPGDALMEEIAPGAASLQCRLHRGRCDREIVEAHRQRQPSLRKEHPARHPGTRCRTGAQRKAARAHRATPQDTKCMQRARRREVPVLPATRLVRRPDPTQSPSTNRFGKSRPPAAPLLGREPICGHPARCKRLLKRIGRSRMLPSVRPLMQRRSRGPVWEFADRNQIINARCEHDGFNWFFRPRLADCCAIVSFDRLHL